MTRPGPEATQMHVYSSRFAKHAEAERIRQTPSEVATPTSEEAAERSLDDAGGRFWSAEGCFERGGGPLLLLGGGGRSAGPVRSHEWGS